MTYLLLKAALSGIIIAVVSETARRAPGVGALIASLPMISILGMVWLWRDGVGADQIAAHAQATFWYVLPSLPMFLIVPVLLKRGVGFWPALSVGCLLTVGLYSAMAWGLQRFSSAR